MVGNTIKDLHVAIVGAGIGGLALAMALHKKGVPFSLYEEAKQYSVVGAGIGFGPNGLQAMDLIDERFRPKYEAICVGNKPQNAQNVFFEGSTMQEGLGTKESWYGSSSWGHPHYTRKSAHRRELLEIMTSFIPAETVKFNKRLVGIQQLPDKVILKFSDGEVVEASALVGADGIKSTVRAHVLQDSYPDQVDPVYADAYCYRGVIPITEAEEILGNFTDVAKFCFGERRSAVTYRISGGTEFNFLLCVADDKPWERKDAVTEEVTHEMMMADFEGHGIDGRFLQLLHKAKPVRWGFFHHRHTARYFRDCVVLVGDSAHASLPFQAAGAAQGVEDALVLSTVLAKIYSGPDKDAPAGPYIRAAFDGYESVRLPRAQRQLEEAADLGRMINCLDPETGSNLSKILSRMQGDRFNWLWFHDLREDTKAAAKRLDDTLNSYSSPCSAAKL